MKSNSYMVSKREKGFTLIELLVVIAIIAVLASLLLPAISRARAAALTAASTSNLRQIHIMMRNYLNDNDGRFPTVRCLHLYPEGANERYWRRVLWEHAFGEFKGDFESVKSAMNGGYSKLMWCPLMVGRHGIEQHETGRGSYGLNAHFIDPGEGGGLRVENSAITQGVLEPYIMAGTTHPAGPYGTWGGIKSAIPEATTWESMTYEYGGDQDRCLSLFLDGRIELISREEANDLNAKLLDKTKLE